MGQETAAEFCLAIPKKGRLKNAFAEVMEMADLTYAPIAQRRDVGTLVDRTSELPAIKARTLGQVDSLRRLRERVVGLAVVGLDALNEFNCAAGCDDFVSEPLNASVCAMWIAAPQSSPIRNWADLSGKRVATSYPATLKDALAKNNISGVEIVEFDGGVEESIDMGLADAVCDLVDTGGTLRANNLVPCLKVYDSSAMLVRLADQAETPLIRAVSQRLKDAAETVSSYAAPSLRHAA